MLVQFERFPNCGTWTVSFGAAMKRCDFFTLFGGAMVARSFAALAQQNATSGRPAKIGVVWHAGMSHQPWPFPRRAMRTVQSGVAASRGTATAHMGGDGAPYRQLRNRPPVNARAAVYAASPEIKFRSKSK
jgi:hypothetical protein